MSKFKGKPKASNTTVDEVTAQGVESFDIPERGIDAATVKHFGVRKLFDVTTQELDGYFFPVTKKGKITGYIQSDPSSPKNDRRFTVVGDANVECELLGQAQAVKAKKLFIVEGFFDLLSAYQSLSNTAKKKGYTAAPAVVSPAFGIGNPKKVTNARKHIANNIQFVSDYSDVVVCFDNDEHKDVNVGQKGVQDVALLLKEFKNCILPVNDCNDMMMEKGETELYFALLTAKPYQHGSIVQGLQDREVLLRPLKKGIKIPSLPNTMNLLHGLREGEFTVVLAPPKCGKTTLCKLINYELMLQGESTLGIYLEESLTKTRQSFIALHAGVHLPMFREDPSIASKVLVEEAFELLSKPNVMFFNDVNGNMSPDNVVAQLEWAVIKGVKYIILDHLSFVFSGDRNSNERIAIDNLMTDIASFVKKTGVHVIAVAHITRDKNKPKPKNSDGSVKYPYWYEVEEQDGRGSGAFEQVCWNMIAIDKQVTEDGSRGLTRTKVILNREWDNTGIGDVLTLNKLSGKLQTYVEEF